MKYLDQIHSPEQLRLLPKKALPEICDELREFLLRVVSEKGGHLASNLGTVELTVAIHYVFDTPRDRVVWDVGHQAYGHKVLTGRKDRFDTIRQFDGLSGFTCRNESEFDPFGAGHASTSISSALGIAEGMRHKGVPNWALAVIGDGSLTGGLVYEAMNNAGHIPAKNLAVIFNDNEMSIDPNVGALAKFINEAQKHPGYNRLRRDMRDLISSVSERGAHLAGKIRRSLKNAFTPGMLFECFGFRYLGPIDGHDVKALVETFEFVKSEGIEGGPFLIHALTTKGKGYSLAEQLPIKYHGVTAFKVEDGIKSSPPKRPNYQDIFADTMIRLAKEDPRVVAITAAMPSGTGLNKFQMEIPHQFYDVGIAEGHAVLFAAGLATEGFRPVAAIYSTFLQRAYDQVIHDVALQNLPVIFAMDRGGLVGADGATHQGAFDLTYLRTVPNMVLMAPKDENELQHMLKTSVDYRRGPIALRYPRGEVVGVPMDRELISFPIGRGELLSADGDELDVLIIGIGYAVQSGLDAVRILRDRGLKVGIINARFVKPLDTLLLRDWVERAGLVVTVEENAAAGGFGAAVLEFMAEENLLKPALVIGMPDTFVEHASPKLQREMTGLDGNGIVVRILKKLETTTQTPVLARQQPSSFQDERLLPH
ncbi:MAG: 1-deoxy-D-xylulose-5-phosphate synthase [Deltaproteobacteria bacterium]|nr:1-deoxy-D-xylulose-5-phosphate synthase [Deltaproteobacteria bacterium]